jgi:Ca-activated chloride channel family protein
VSGDVIASLAAAAALGVALSAWRSGRELRRWLGRDPFGGRRPVRAALAIGAILLVAWALWRAAQTPPRLTAAGADMVLALDVSRSMNARDVAPSRLRRALQLAGDTVRAAEGVRIALVVFAGDAYVALPLTQDADALLTYLNALDSEVISRAGSDLARALDVSAGVFDPRSSRARQILLLTDGEHAEGDLETSLAALRSQGVRVLPVGFGTPDGSEVPGQGAAPLRDHRGNDVWSRRADGVLRRIAAATDGAYLRELEDRPSPGRLLPAPEPDASPQAEPAPDGTAGIEAALATAVALLGLELLLSFGGLRLPRLAFFGTRARAALVVLAALSIAAGPASWLEEGDAHLARGEARIALSLYNKAERHTGETPDTRIRIGNAEFRLGQLERAAGAYLAALRRLDSSRGEARFVASFNLGTVLLEQERFREARDAFWSALLDRPESVEARFNYEWALVRMEPEPDVPLPPPPDATSSDTSADGAQAPQAAQTDDSEERVEQLTEAEAERWLQSIQESLAEPLHRQARKSLEEAGEPPQGQTW